MNSANALGFLVLGSLMNALPALAPAVVSHGIVIDAGLTEGAIWLHFMGLFVAAIGSGRLLSDGVASYRAATRAALRMARPAGQPAAQQASTFLQTA